MGLLSRFTSSFRRSETWMAARDVLPVERALADEHEALHGESIRAELDAVTVDFDESQVTDGAAIARALHAALASGGAASIELDAEPTPRDAVCRFLMRDAALQAAVRTYVSATEHARDDAARAFASVLTTRLNELLGSRLMDEAAFRPFVDGGAIAALGVAPSGATESEAQARFLRRANRALLEAAFPREVALMRDRRLAVVYEAARRRDTAALCLSGGGIRSSTFALGIMQGLARHGLLGKFDYLSTVSGGGLSGGWLSAWMRREGAPAVHEALRSHGSEKLQPGPEPVQGLRAFSHWLTPSAGAMSIDSWTVIATIVRNLLLNWLVLLPLMAGLVMLPRLLLSVLALDFHEPSSGAATLISYAAALGLLCMLGSAAYLEWVRSSGETFGKGRRGAPSQTQVLLFFLLPRALGSVVLTIALWVAWSWHKRVGGEEILPRLFETVVLTLLITPIVVVGMALVRRGRQTVLHTLARSVKVLISGVIGYVLPMLLLFDLSREVYVTVAPVVLLLGSVVASQLYAGFTSNEAGDAEREWSARANAWVFIVAIAWTVSSGMVTFGPRFLAGVWQKLTLVGIGGVSSWLTVFLSKRAPAPAGTARSGGDRLRAAALSLSAPAVVGCVIVGLAAANDHALNLICLNDALSRQYQCAPPSVDSTSVPMLDYLSWSYSRDAEAAAGDLMASFDSATATLKGGRYAATQSRVDSALEAASRDLTTITLAYDRNVARRIRRTGEVDGPANAERPYNADAVMQSFRAFTLARNRNLITVQAYEGAPVVPALVERALADDSVLKAGFVRRAAAADSIAQLVDSARTAKGNQHPAERALWIGVLALMAAMIVAGLFFSTVVNTNTFSLHAMWKVRTVRAFLGTTRAAAARNPNPFTGFDSDDDVQLRDLWPAPAARVGTPDPWVRSEAVPPMHVLNVTLNLAAGRNLAWQQRKGESMTLTPLHGGSAFVGYRPMEANANAATGGRLRAEGYGGSDGVSLGTAMAISGAAASPNDGSGTTALSAFLMTFFNARLGWWLGNPGAAGADTWQRSAPKQRLTPILSEMFGLTSDRSQYVYLSDGGHFENLALYEMVLRRCRFIVVSDAGADPDYTFEDLGNAVRKMRIDFGVPIDFEEPVNIHGRDGNAGTYWATARIGYSAIDMPEGGNPDDYDGVLVYVKPAVYGNEPRDVVNYHSLSPTFPQETSADQFFSESQFESYRELGSWIVDQLVTNPAAGGPRVKVNARRDGSLLSAWLGLAAWSRSRTQ